MSNNEEEKVKVVDEKCKVTSSNNHEQNECGYWIHINHIFNCYSDCKVYMSTFDHFLKRKGINEQGLIMVPLSHKIFNISNVVGCLICDDKNCYICNNLSRIVNGCKSLCSCNEDIRDDHAVIRINWFISNFKMCATMKERFESNSKSKHFKLKNDSANKTKEENGLKETNNKGNKSNINSECSNRSKVVQCECDKSNPAHSSGITKKYSKVKTKNMNNTVKFTEKASLKSVENNNSKGNKSIREHNEKLLLDDKKVQAHLTSSIDVQKNCGAKKKVSDSLASDLQILTRDSFSRFAEKFDSLNVFGHQCLFCTILGHFYDGKYCDLIIPEFCIKDRRQTTCDKSANEKDCFGKQYCLTVENVHIKPGVGPKLIGTFSKNHIPLLDLDKGMNYDKNGDFENSKSKILKKKKSRMSTCLDEIKENQKKE